MPLSDPQIVFAMIFSLIPAVLAISLGTALYK